MRYICGTIDSKLRDKFLRESKPTLELFNEIVNQHEIAESSVRAITDPVHINVISKKVPTMKELDAKHLCYRCGGKYDKDHNPNSCQHKNTECRECNKIGHLARMCQKNNWQANQEYRKEKARRTKIKEVTTSEHQEEEVKGEDEVQAAMNKIRISSIDENKKQSVPKMNVVISNEKTSFAVRALADTGAGRTIISKDIVKRSNLPIFKAKINLTAANDSPMTCSGQTPIAITYRDIAIKTIAIVSSDLQEEVIIGFDDLKALKVIHEEFPNVQISKIDTSANVAQLKEEFSDVFSNTISDQPMAGPPMEIHLKQGAKPTRQVTTRPYPIHWQEAAEEAVEQLLTTVLEKEDRPTEWVSPGFFVLKGDPAEKRAMKEGHAIITMDKLRLVVDYTNLNKWVDRPIHPFPPAQLIIDRIPPNAKFFCKMDCVSGYHQIGLTEASSLLTTFILPGGRYRFKRTPMGLNASSDEWCRRSDEVIKGIRKTQKIVDDILICGDTMDELLDTIRQVLKNCREQNIVISEKKFAIGTTVKFAGFIISSNGVQPDPDKIKAIKISLIPKIEQHLEASSGSLIN